MRRATGAEGSGRKNRRKARAAGNGGRSWKPYAHRQLTLQPQECRETHDARDPSVARFVLGDRIRSHDSKKICVAHLNQFVCRPD